ncbi:MAG TPA: hypothetical protein VIJ20_09550, partial [Solirubrobacteraceae bacterium]
IAGDLSAHLGVPADVTSHAWMAGAAWTIGKSTWDAVHSARDAKAKRDKNLTNTTREKLGRHVK